MRKCVSFLTTPKRDWSILAVRRGIALCLLMLTWTGIAWAGSATYTYDALGRLSSVTYGSGVTITYVYDAAGNRTSYVVSGAP